MNNRVFSGVLRETCSLCFDCAKERFGAASCATTRKYRRQRAAIYRLPLLQARADFDVFVGKSGENGSSFRADRCGDDHAVRFHAAQFSWRKIHHDRDFSADQFLRFVKLRNAGANLANLRANVHGKLQQLIRADDAFGGLNLPDAHFDFGEIFDADFFRRRSCRCATRSCYRRGSCRRCRWLCRIQFFVCHRFDPFDCFLFIHAWEERLRLAKLHASDKLSPTQSVQFDCRNSSRLSEQRPNFRCAFRQNRMCEHRHDAQQFRRRPKNRCFALRVGFGIAHRPRLLRSQIFIGGSDGGPDRFERTGKFKFLEAVERFADGFTHRFCKRFILWQARARFRNFSAETLFNHRGCAAREIAKPIGKIAVVARDQRIVTEIAVLAEHDFAHQKITHRVHAEHVRNRTRQYNVSFGLAHFARVHQEPAVRPDLFWHRQHRRHQECGPVHRVKTNDVFSDEMQIARPEAALFVFWTADGAEVRRERIEPDVKHVRLLARNRNAPANRGTRDAQILQTAFDETDNFVLARFRLNESRIPFVKIEQRFLKRGQLEIVIFFGDGFRGAAAIGTVVARFRFGHERVVVDAVLPGVNSFVDVTVFSAKFEKPLHGPHVLDIRGANKFISGNSKLVPKRFPRDGHPRHVFRLWNARFLRGAFDVHAVLVRTRGHHDFVAAHALVTANRISNDRRIRVADVWQAVRVVDRRGQIEFWFATGHWEALSNKLSVLSCKLKSGENGLGHLGRWPLQRRRTLKRTLQLLEIAFCFVHYLVQRNVLFFREFLAVFKFGGGVTNVAVDARDFYADVAELRVDAYGFARERAALCAIGSCAERGGLGKNEIHQCRRIVRPAKQSQQDSRAILFHLHGSRVNVEGAGGERFFLKVAVDLRIHVVEICFDHGDFLVESGDSFFRGFADQDADNVGLAFEIGGARTVTDGGNAHRRLRTEGSAKRGDDGRACWCDEFLLHAVGVRWLPLQQFRGCGSRHGQNAVRHFRGAAADVQGRAGELLDAKGFKSDAGADDVHDGVDRANFVKMNFFDGHVVNGGFSLAEFAKNCGGLLANSRRELRFLQNVENGAERTMFALVFGLHFYVRGRHAVLPDFFGRDFPAGNIESAQLFAQVVERNSSVNQSAERHVAADPAKTVKIREFHENLPPYGYYRRVRGVSNLERKKERKRNT